MWGGWLTGRSEKGRDGAGLHDMWGGWLTGRAEKGSDGAGYMIRGEDG